MDACQKLSFAVNLTLRRFEHWTTRRQDLAAIANQPQS